MTWFIIVSYVLLSCFHHEIIYLIEMLHWFFKQPGKIWNFIKFKKKPMAAITALPLSFPIHLLKWYATLGVGQSQRRVAVIGTCRIRWIYSSLLGIPPLPHSSQLTHQPKWLENDSKMTRKWLENDSKMTRKWLGNDSEMTDYHRPTRNRRITRWNQLLLMSNRLNLNSYSQIWCIYALRMLVINHRNHTVKWFNRLKINI